MIEVSHSCEVMCGFLPLPAPSGLCSLFLLEAKIAGRRLGPGGLWLAEPQALEAENERSRSLWGLLPQEGDLSPGLGSAPPCGRKGCLQGLPRGGGGGLGGGVESLWVGEGPSKVRGGWAPGWGPRLGQLHGWAREGGPRSCPYGERATRTTPAPGRVADRPGDFLPRPGAWGQGQGPLARPSAPHRAAELGSLSSPVT